MKKVLLFCFMGATDLAFAQTGQSLPVSHSDTSAKKPTILIRCGNTLKKGDQPLLVVDGMIWEYGNLNEIKPAAIENIMVLKESTATAIYGNRAARGVIVIITKKIRERTFSIRSKEDGAPVGRATIKVINEEIPVDTITIMANDEGEIVTSRLDDKKSYTAFISSVGYKPQQVSLSFKGRADHPVFYIERRENVCENITVIAYHTRRIICRCGCRVVTTRTWNGEANKELVMHVAGIYPNPATSTGVINLKLEESFEGSIQVLNVSGQLVQSAMISGSKGGVLSYRLPALAAGTYLIRLVDQRSSRSRTEKLMVQSML